MNSSTYSSDNGIVNCHTTFDMRVIGVGITMLDGIIVPYKASVGFMMNELGILEVRAYWEEKPDEERPMGMQRIVLLSENTQHEVSPDLSIEQIIGSIVFEGRTFLMCRATIEHDYTFLAVLKPQWATGGFAYKTVMRLPPPEFFINSWATFLHEEDQDITEARFVVYVVYDRRGQCKEHIVSVEPTPHGTDYYDVFIRESTPDVIVRPMAISDLKNCSLEIEDEIEGDEE